MEGDFDIAAIKPYLPDRIFEAEENICSASNAAKMPSCAALAGCNCFDIAPSAKNSHNPAVIVPALPIAERVS